MKFMDNIDNSIREVAEKLLNDKKVECIIGYEKGTLPLRTTPCFVTKVEDAKKLVWNPTCDATLSKYVLGRKGKVGVIAKGCDARLITVCALENQFPKENVVVIGVPCIGVVDRKKIESKLEGKEILEATIENDQIKVKGDGFELALPLKDFLSDSCITCTHKNAPNCDVFVGEKVPENTEGKEFAEVSNLEAKSSDERWKHFEEELSKCIRCYACRNACPLCYCKTCVVDASMPAWIGKTNDPSDTMIYHIARTLHAAGRCVDCGACSRACPMGINLRELVKKAEKIMKERYGYEAGVSPDKVPPLGENKADDSQEFIK